MHLYSLPPLSSSQPLSMTVPPPCFTIGMKRSEGLSLHEELEDVILSDHNTCISYMVCRKQNILEFVCFPLILFKKGQNWWRTMRLLWEVGFPRFYFGMSEKGVLNTKMSATLQIYASKQI